MLVEYKVKNFACFKDEATFSMLKPENAKEESCISDTAAIYGANASGKSQLIRSLAMMRLAVVNSVKDDDLLKMIWSQRYAFDDAASKLTMKMQILIEEENIYYRYGFEIKESEIEHEWLYMQQENEDNEILAFERDKQKIKVLSDLLQNAKVVMNNTRKNALFLSTASMLNVHHATVVRNWFRTKLLIMDNTDLDNSLNYTSKLYAHERGLSSALKDFITNIDLGIVDIDIKEQDVDLSKEEDTIETAFIKQQMKLQNMPNDVKVRTLKAATFHKHYTEHVEDGIVSFPFKKESLGTQKVFALLGPWTKTLKDGGVLIIDEFGASLHTLLASELLNMFQFCNAGKAQLIVSTHDTNLLIPEHFDKDQIWFVEKNRYGESCLYSLAEFNTGNISVETLDVKGNYLKGKFGAIPFVGNAHKFIENYGK